MQPNQGNENRREYKAREADMGLNKYLKSARSISIMFSLLSSIAGVSTVVLTH
jgi:hypothetical protein